VALLIRHDAGYAGGKYTWASSKESSCGSPVHVPLGVAVPSEVVRLTEGPLKGDVSTAISGTPTVAVPGVAAWALAVPVLKQMGVKKVLLAFDQDGKPGTLAAMEQALLALTRSGFEVALEWWDPAAGKGIDDLLVGGKQPEVLTGLQAYLRVRDAVAPPAAAAQEITEPEPPPLPLDAFPPALADYLRQVAEATSSPPDFAALTLLATAGAAIGNGRALCLKSNSWYEAPRIYGVNLGAPSSGKTPAMETVVKPYQDLQLRLIAAYKGAKAAYDKAVADYEQALKESRALPAGERQPRPQAPAEPEPPERLVVMDATVESLAPLLERNPRGLLMAQDEVVGWVRGMGQYKGGRGNDRQFWLSAWSGTSHFVDRKSQGLVPVTIARPFVNVVGGAPPEMLTELADHKGRRDGFLDRLLFVFPRACAGADWSEAAVSDAAKQAWEKTLVALRKLAMQELEGGGLGYRVVEMSPAAKEAWVDYYNAHAAEMRSPELPVHLISPWGKLKSYAARLALVLHYLWLVQGDGGEGPLDAASVERAAKLIEYFKGHLERVYRQLRVTPEDNHLMEVVAWVRQQGRCTARDLVHSKKVTPTSAARKFLEELQERGYGRLEWQVGGNGHKVQQFVFAPA
jgi:hypothetical protein